MDGYDDIVRGKNGFSYEVKSLDERGITDIRDARDELFAQLEYTPETGEYIVEIDGGYSTHEDLRELGFIDGMDTHEGQVPEFDNMIGAFENEVIDDLTEIEYASLNQNGRTLEIENIRNDERKTLIRLISEDEDICSAATKLVNMFNSAFIHGATGDPYGETWAPFSNGRVVRENSDNREETIKKVFDTATTLTEDILEKKKRSRE